MYFDSTRREPNVKRKLRPYESSAHSAQRDLRTHTTRPSPHIAATTSELRAAADDARWLATRSPTGRILAGMLVALRMRATSRCDLSLSRRPQVLNMLGRIMELSRCFFPRATVWRVARAESGQWRGTRHGIDTEASVGDVDGGTASELQ